MKMRTATLITFLAGLCLAVLAIAGIAADSASPLLPGPDYPERDFSEANSWDVVRVVGANRLIIKNAGKQRTVKLIGVAEPQVKRPKLNPAANHIQAVEFLSNLLAGEEVFVLEAQSSEGTHGELDAVKLFRVPDGLYVNLELVRQGYTQMLPGGLGSELGLFRTYEQRAKLMGKGLWNKSLALVPAVKKPSGVIVYVTKTGKKYHRQNCRFLAKSKVALSLDEAKRRGFTPCRVCKPPR